MISDATLAYATILDTWLDAWPTWAVAGTCFAAGALAGGIVRGIRAKAGDPRHGKDSAGAEPAGQ